MPPFKGPSIKSQQLIGAQYKGPMFKGPMFKGPPINTAVKAKPWTQPKGPPASSFNSYPLRQFGPPKIGRAHV